MGVGQKRPRAGDTIQRGNEYFRHQPAASPTPPCPSLHPAAAPEALGCSRSPSSWLRNHYLVRSLNFKLYFTLGKVPPEGRRAGFLIWGIGLGKREGLRRAHNYCISTCDIIVLKFSSVKWKRSVQNFPFIEALILVGDTFSKPLQVTSIAFSLKRLTQEAEIRENNFG